MKPDNVTIKGIFIQQTLDRVKKETTPEVYRKIKNEIGEGKISAFKDYPVEMQKKIENQAARYLFGDDPKEADYRYGKVSFETFAESPIGKTMFALMGHDVKRLALSMKRLWDTVTTGLIIETEDLGERKVSVRIKNSPYACEGMIGLFESGIKHLGQKGKVEFVDHGDCDHEFILEWAEKK